MNSFAAMWLQFALLFSFYIGISFCIDCQHLVKKSTIRVSSSLNEQYGKDNIMGLSDIPWVGGGTKSSSNWVNLEFQEPIKFTNISMTGGDVNYNGTVKKCYVTIFVLDYRNRNGPWKRYKPKFTNVTPDFNAELKDMDPATSINITIKRYNGCPAVNLELGACESCSELYHVDNQTLNCKIPKNECTYQCKQGYKANNGHIQAVKHCQLNGNWTGPNLMCDDENECEKNICNSHASCINTPGSYRCSCNAGFTGQGCTDIDECKGTHGCTNGRCVNSEGSYSCSCNPGYKNHDDRSCVDINECNEGTHGCKNGKCVNSPGSYSCSCNSGYRNHDDRSCVDIDECIGKHGCRNATCDNSPGSYSCSCNPGYNKLDDRSCIDINECASSSHLCDKNATCTNTPGTYLCNCESGYTGDGRVCQDIDECEQKKCSQYSTCNNTVGSFVCTCLEGFEGDGINCVGDDVKITSIGSSNTENKFRFGERLTLFCNATGLPVPGIEWKIKSNNTDRETSSDFNRTKHWSSSTLVIESLKVNDTGSYTCIARNMEGTHKKEIYVTVIGTPTSPKFSIGDVTDTSVHVSWKEPSDKGSSAIDGYVVRYNSSAEEIVTRIVNDKLYQLVINGLKPDTKYKIWVVARNKQGESEHNIVQATTLAPKPVTLPQPKMDTASATSSSVKIQVKKFDSQYKAALQVIVQKISKRRKRSTADFPTSIFDYKTSKCEELLECYYIAAELPNDDTDFIVGDGKKYGDYENVELEPATTYNIYTRGVSYNNDIPEKVNIGEPSPRLQVSTEGTESKNGKTDSSVVGLAVGLSVVVVVLIILAFLAFIYFRSRRPQTIEIDPETGEKKGRKKINSELLPLTRKGHGKKKSGQVEDGSPDPNHPPVPTSGFAKYVGKLHKSDDRGFMIQYNTLETSQTYTSDFATSPENKEKNRYANIVAYDVSRVHLKMIDDDDNSSYINASLVDGYNSANAYIATQGPLPGTFNDFWRMVWERNCSSIVMLTNLQERHKLKCHKYWPEESEVYGEITVISTRREQYADYVIRTFLLKMNETEEEREIKQFHFTVWPDHGVPEYPTAILAFQRRVRAYSTRDSGPLAVHCSAGVGRSGTFIVIDCMLARIQSEQAVDIYNYVRYLRTRRMYMVQTEEQYVFCHDALLESILCGNTQMSAHNLRIEMNKLRERDATTKMSGYETEFKTLNKVSPSLPKESFTVATYAVNASKNRYHDILASDHDRVILGDEDDKDDGPYINAVYVDGYKQQNAFVLTQAPLKDTIKDFWQMMYEKNSACLLLLANLTEEEGDFPQFWPDEESEDYDLFNVELVSDASKGDIGSEDQFQQEKLSEDIVERKLKITKEEDKSLAVKMFQHLSWTETSVPTDISAIISLIQRIEKWQQHSGNGPITIVCNDGQGRSGTLAALCSVLERVKTEQVVDVFQTIKALRIHRPGLVKHVEQYQFIHLGVQEYLDSFSDYANFK